MPYSSPGAVHSSVAGQVPVPDSIRHEDVSSTARRLTAGSALRFASQFAAVISAFVLTPLVVHRLGDQLYGIWSIVGALVTYTSLLEMGMTSAMTRFLSRALGAGRRDECEVYFNFGLRVYALLGGIVLMIGVLAAALVPVLWRHSPYAGLLSHLILIFSIGNAAFFATRAFTGALTAELRYDHVATADLAAILLRSGATVYVLLADYGVVALAWASVVGWVAYLLVAACLLRRDLPFLRFRLRLPAGYNYRSLLSYGGYAFISQLADMLRYQTDAFVMASVVSVAAVTHYRVAGMITLYALQLLNPALAIFQPVFSRQEARGDRLAIQKTFLFAGKIALSVSCFTAFGLIFWGKPFVERWMGPAYLDAYPCLVLLAIGCALAVSAYPGINLLFGVSRHRIYAFLTLTEGVLNVLLSIVLARRYGMLGVALGTVIPMFCIRALVLPLYFCRVAGIRYFRYAATMGRHLAVIASCLFVAWLIAARRVAPDYLQLVVTAVAAALVYGALQWFTLLDSAERLLLRSALRPRFKFTRAAPSI